MRYAPVLLVLASCAVPMQPDEPDAGSTPPVLDAAKDAPRESMVTSDAGFDAATDAPTESAADAGFDPKAVPGLVLWLDASKGVTQNNGSVSAWADQSGNANDAKQATAQLQPQFQSGGINGKPSIHVSGGQHFTIADSTSLQWGSGDFYIAIALATSEGAHRRT